MPGQYHSGCDDRKKPVQIAGNSCDSGLADTAGVESPGRNRQRAVQKSHNLIKINCRRPGFW